jgi:hypothetical protein
MMMVKYLNSFWKAGFSSFTLVSLIGSALRIARLPFNAFMLTLFGLGVWVILLVITRLLLISTDLVSARTALASLAQARKDFPVTHGALEAAIINSVRSGLGRTGQWVDARSCIEDLEMLSKPFDEAETTIHLWYIPIQALVWALPAIVFIGTAWTMRALLVALHAVVAQLQSIDINVISTAAPYLNDALTIISLALALSAVTYLAVSLVLKHDLDSLRWLKSALSTLHAENRSVPTPEVAAPASRRVIEGS